MSTAIVTGASSGIGREIAICLSNEGYDLVLVARRQDKLAEVSRELKKPAKIIVLDLSKEANCYSLFEHTKNDDVEILVNNAGFGLLGEFSEADLERECEMIDLNVRSLHILTKLYLLEFKRRNRGKILNVASAAAFLPEGPMMAAYYSTKAYVLTLTRSIRRELKKSGSCISVSALCPGPVKTEFDKVAGVDFFGVGMNAEKVAKTAVSGLLKGKAVITPGILMKLGGFFARFVPPALLGEFAYRFQRAKKGYGQW